MTESRPEHFDVCIVGGGIVGLTQAALLSELDLSVAVVEQSGLPPSPASTDPAADEYSLRVSAINLASMRIFQHLGIARNIRDTRASGYRRMQIWDANSDAGIQFKADDIDHEFLGFIIENDLIINKLFDLLDARKNVVFFNIPLCSLDQETNGIRIGLGESSIQAALLIGADGQFSRVRKLAGIATEAGLFNQRALVCRIATELPHRQTAYQCFHHHGPIAYLPLADGSSSIVWSCDTDRARELSGLDDPAFAEAIEHAMQSALGRISIKGPRGAFDLAQQHALSYIAPRIALVGDAAHRTHPLAGLGANLGLQDAAVLSEQLELALSRHRPFHGNTALRRYERIRKHQNSLVLSAMQAFKSGFASSSPAVTSLRALAMNSADRMWPLKSLISQLATGDMGDLPRICRPGANHDTGY